MTTKLPHAERPAGRDAALTAILEAAADLFAIMPFTDVTMRAVASRANVNLGLIHRHVGSKEVLLRKVMQNYAERFRVEISGAGSLEEALALIKTDPAQRRFLRTLAYLLLSNVPLDDYLTRNGGVDALLRFGAAGKSGHRPRKVAPLLAALALLMGWTLFEPFLMEVSGQQGARKEISKDVFELASTMLR